MLRPYQSSAINEIKASHDVGHRCLAVMATGTGKTHVFVEYLPNCQGRAMIIANREELVHQAHQKVVATGSSCDIEQANYWSDEFGMFKAPAVVASIQSLNASWTNKYREKKRRFERFDWKGFGLIVVDEAHHCVSESYKRVLRHALRENPNIKILGVTATPDRLDKKAMGTVFTDVAYRYEIDAAMHDGWLVPVKQKMIHVESLDFTDIRTTAGDFNGGELARLMEYEKNLHAVAVPTMEAAAGRPTLIFASSVKQSERIAEIINRQSPGSARSVDGKMDRGERRQLLKDFEAGKFSYLCNCQIATEGWDCPKVEYIAIARPTKSRALYTQMVGRGTRILPKVVDGLEDAEHRRAAISGSDKPCCHVLDFVGNSGQHRLICTADILAGDDEVLSKRVRIRMEQEGETDVQEVVEEERQRLTQERKEIEEKKRSGILATVQWSSSQIDPFKLLAVKPRKPSQWTNNEPLSENQRQVLMRQNIDPDSIPAPQQRQLMEQIFKRQKKGLSTLKQIRLLHQLGVPVADAKKMTMNQASTKIDSIKNVSSMG